ncbi:MAG: phospholipase D-like domain-containing protein [Porticoccaceae bacterium]
MEMYSTQLAQEPNKFTVDELLNIDGAVRDLTIISAYTDIKMLRTLCRKARRNADGRTSGPRVRIFLDRQASTYESDPAMKNIMDRFSRRLKEDNSDSGIWLVKVGPLFHAKAVVVETNTSICYMLGSLNMTQKAFSKNEELVGLGYADIDGKAADNKIARWISGDYCDRLKSQDQTQLIPFPGKTTLPQDSLQSLLLSGIMFHEEKESDPFRFNIRLPAEFLRIKQSVHPLMSAELKDSISLEAIVCGDEIDDGLGRRLPKSEQDGNRESWKKYCLDTCYGFWCPDVLRQDAESAVKKNRNFRSPKYEGKDGLFEIVKTEQKKLTSCFSNILDKLDVQICEQLPKERTWNKQEVLDRWSKWYSALLNKLKNEEICNRIIMGVSSAPVPNVWSDPITSRVFEKSWTESIQFAWSKDTRFKKVLQTLNDKYDIDLAEMRDADADEVLEYLETQIAKEASDDIADEES